MLKAIIVDDEPNCCESLNTLLERNCPQIEVIDICYSPISALQSIIDHKPQIVFLDIEMPHMNGFELLEKIEIIDFKIIFTTSYDQYAIKAIHLSALDYLLKPIDRIELQNAVQKVMDQLTPPMPQQIEILLQRFQNSMVRVNKIAIPTMEGLQMILIDSIISCGADSNYTIIFLKNKQKIIASRTLKEIEDILSDYFFIRVHHSWVVNLNEVEKYIKGEGGYLLMSDSSVIDISRSRKELLLQKLRPGRF